MKDVSSELGLASLLFGAVLFVTAPLSTILAAEIWSHADRTPQVVLAHAWMARTSVLVVALTAASGLWFGLRGWRRARREGHHSELCRAGVILCTSATALWVVAGAALLNTTESLVRLSNVSRIEF